MRTRLIQIFTTFFAVLIVCMSFFHSFVLHPTSAYFPLETMDDGTGVTPGPGGSTGVSGGPGGSTGVSSGPGGGSGVSPGPGGTTGITNPVKQDNICKLINSLVNIVVEIGAIVAVLFIIWSGFLFIKAQGKPDELTKAKNTFYMTLIGTAILVGASVITKIIVNTVFSVTGDTTGGGICKP